VTEETPSSFFPVAATGSGSPWQPGGGTGAPGAAPMFPPPPPPPPPPPRDAVRASRRVEPVLGTPFGLVYVEVPPVTSGTAVGALIAGIASVLVSLVVVCFGLLGAQDGWGAWAAGAFALLGAATGVTGLALGELSRRQIRRVAPPPGIRFTGHGMALAGLACGAAGLGITGLAFLMALVLQLI
jgi:hypothetical protein